MALGMTYEQYWYGDPWMVVTFRKAHELKKNMLNEQMWLMGLYVSDAVESAISGFGNRKRNYMNKPIDFRARADAEKAKEKVNNLFKGIQAAWTQKGKANG